MSTALAASSLARAQWLRARDCFAGEAAIKAKGETYLPRLDSQSDDEYQAYVTRAAWWAGASQVLEDCLAAAFRRPPTLQFSAPDLEPQLASFLADCDGLGTSFTAYARGVLAEVLTTGRALTHVSAAGTTPTLTLYRAEDILDWQESRGQGTAFLASVSLRQPDASILTLRVHQDQVLQERHSPEGLLLHRTALKRDGVSVPVLPVVFHTPSGRPATQRAPLADLVDCNLDHYRLSADHRHGLHLAALPTAWVAGFDKTTPLRVGSNVAWVSETSDASAGFLEYRGTGLLHVAKAIEATEARLLEMRDRLLGLPPAAQTPGARTAPPVGAPGLAGCIQAISASHTRVLSFADSWITGHPWTAAARLSYAISTDLAPAPLLGADLTAVVEAWRAGAISRETLLDALGRGDLLPYTRSTRDEKLLLHRAI